MTTPRPLPKPVRFGLAAPRGQRTGDDFPSPAALDAALEIGCDRVELTLIWGDGAALERAVAADQELSDRGLDAVVALDAGAGGSWLGLDSPRRFEAWAREVVARLPRARTWIPLVRPNLNARRAHLTWRRPSTRALLRTLDHQLAAHVLATDVIHRSRPGASVVCNLATEMVYELDGLLLDVLVAPAAGIARPEIGDFLRERRSIHYRSPDSRGHPRATALIRRLARSFIPLEQALPTAIAAVYSCDEGSIDRVRRTTSPHFRPAISLPLELEVGPDDPVESAGGAVRRDPSVAVVWIPSADDRFRQLTAALRADSTAGEKRVDTAL